jgi:hypothetical protein
VIPFYFLIPFFDAVVTSINDAMKPKHHRVQISLAVSIVDLSDMGDLFMYDPVSRFVDRDDSTMTREAHIDD